MSLDPVEQAVADAHRREWALVLAAVVRTARDLDLAEEATQEAYLSALERWRDGGIPASPGAWLVTTARRKALDRLRRERTLRRKLPLLIVPDGPADPVQPLPGAPVRDERLRLIFLCCHPALAPEARIALTLRLVCGLTTAEIARLFLVAEPAMAARLTRAKRKIRAAGVPYRMPSENELPDRLPAILAVLYLLFTAGHTAPGGPALTRPELAGQSIAMARLIGELVPANAESGALLALLLLTHARQGARLDTNGRAVALAEQDRRKWDQGLLKEGIELVERALPLSRGKPGPYALQAAIAAVHAEAESYETTDWAQLVLLHDWLYAVHPSPVVALDRAVARSMIYGPEAGLAEVGELAADPRLASYHLLPAVRADLLRRLGRTAEAAREYAEAARLAGNEGERDYLRRRVLDLSDT